MAGVDTEATAVAEFDRLVRNKPDGLQFPDGSGGWWIIVCEAADGVRRFFSLRNGEKEVVEVTQARRRWLDSFGK